MILVHCMRCFWALSLEKKEKNKSHFVLVRNASSFNGVRRFVQFRSRVGSEVVSTKLF